MTSRTAKMLKEVEHNWQTCIVAAWKGTPLHRQIPSLLAGREFKVFESWPEPSLFSTEAAPDRRRSGLQRLKRPQKVAKIKEKSAKSSDFVQFQDVQKVKNVVFSSSISCLGGAANSSFFFLRTPVSAAYRIDMWPEKMRKNRTLNIFTVVVFYVKFLYTEVLSGHWWSLHSLTSSAGPASPWTTAASACPFSLKAAEGDYLTAIFSAVK